MNRTFFFASIPLIALCFCIVGCDEVYSEAVRYTVRTDPVPLKKLGDEFPFPDQPGQLPILSIANFHDERNPYFITNQKADLLNEKFFRDPTKVPEADRQRIRDVLDKLFGTPAKPTVSGIDDESLRQQALELLQLKDETLAEGSKYYRVYCLHCHGVTGDGRGPTARWVNPHPRDYRQGKFKFESVNQTKGEMPPHRDDLMRTVELGVEGTAMPSFSLLELKYREALVSYVIHLSLRGKAEYDLLSSGLDPNTLKPDLEPGETLEQRIKAYNQMNVAAWVASQDPANRITVEEMPAAYKTEQGFKESVARGHKLFVEPPPGKTGEGLCIACHKDYGRQSNFRFDEWGTFAKPQNLLLGVYRGGRRPIDIYYRIHSGIPPSTMNGFAVILPPDTSKGTHPLWDLVNFVRVIGNPTMRQQMGIYVD